MRLIVIVLSIVLAASLASALNISLSVDGTLYECKIPSTVTPAPIPPVTPPVTPPVIPPTTGGGVLSWGLNPINGGMASFAAGETKTWIARIPKQVRGFEVIYTPQSEFRVDCTFKMPYKPNGAAYKTRTGQTSWKLWAGYDGAIQTRIWSQALGGIVLEPAIYPGDFTLTCTADRAGWGSLTTSLTE